MALALTAGFPVHGAERVALVIGNNAYVNTVPLRNPVSDAQAISDVLEEAGYDVIRANDADVRSLLRALSGFKERAREAEAAIFYYAGHGVEVKGENYLLPIDATLEEEVDLDLETLPLKKVVDNLGEAKATLKVIVLDCCRDNPLKTRSWMAKRSGGSGLAAVAENQLAEGTMVVYAGAPGVAVPDGAGGHSPFATALLEELAVPGQSIVTVFSRVAKKVEESEPWIRFDGSGKSLAAFAGYPLLPGAAPPIHPPTQPAVPGLSTKPAMVAPKPAPAPRVAPRVAPSQPRTWERTATPGIYACPLDGRTVNGGGLQGETLPCPGCRGKFLIPD